MRRHRHQAIAPQPQQQQDQAIHERRRQAGRTPPHPGAQNGKEGGGQGPAQVAGQAVHAVGIAQAWGGHALVQDGEVDRVKRGIAQARQHGGQHKRRIALTHRRDQAGRDKAEHREQHHRPRAKAVDHKAGAGLAHARNHKEDGGEQAQLRVAPAELGQQKRKQQGQDQVREMRAGVRKAHQAHDLGVLAPGHGGFKGCGSAHGARRSTSLQV